MQLQGSKGMEEVKWLSCFNEFGRWKSNGEVVLSLLKGRLLAHDSPQGRTPRRSEPVCPPGPQGGPKLAVWLTKMSEAGIRNRGAVYPTFLPPTQNSQGLLTTAGLTCPVQAVGKFFSGETCSSDRINSRNSRGSLQSKHQLATYPQRRDPRGRKSSSCTQSL